MADKLPEMYIVALEVLDDSQTWQTAHTWFAGDIEPVTYSGIHVARGGVKSSLSRTIGSPPTLEEVLLEAENNKQEWIDAGLPKSRIRVSKTPFRARGKDINSDDDE